MSATVDCVFQLSAREHAPLLLHAVCGDALMPPDGSDDWFALTRVSRSDRSLTFVYEGAQAVLRLYATLPEDFDADWVAAQRERLSPHGAEKHWAHFVAQLGRFNHAGEGEPVWAEASFVHDAKTWRARRARHPAAVIDRLLARDRAEAEERLQWLIGSGDTVGEGPRESPRANVGDKRFD